MPEMIERVARAICKADGFARQSTAERVDGGLMTVDEYADAAWRLYMGHARRAIAAMQGTDDADANLRNAIEGFLGHR